MLEHLSDQTVDLYRRRSLSPSELLAANDHLTSCDACYLRFSVEGELELAYALAKTSLEQSERATAGHLLYEEIAAYLANELRSQEAAFLESHLTDCGECRLELEELRSLKETLSNDSYGLKEAQPLRERLRALWLQPAFRMAVWMAVPIAAALLIWITVGYLLSRNSSLESQIASLRQDNERLRNENDKSQLALADLKAQLAESQPPDAGYSAGSSEGIEIAINDGNGKLTLDGKGNLIGLKSLPGSFEQLLKNVLVSQRIATPPIVSKLRGKSGVLMGSAANDHSFKLLSPVAVAVLSDRPTFRWSELGGASGYIVTVYGANSKEVASSELLSSTEWVPSFSLTRGRIYAWQVRAIKDGNEVRIPSPEFTDVKFQVLDRAKATELTRARREFRNYHLLLGVLYLRAGLLDEAEQEFTALVDANPQSVIARRLLDSFRSIRK